jgi:Zn finger protein HypA/HybF involved in hydrogenase expression
MGIQNSKLKTQNSVGWVDGYTASVHEMGIALEVYRTCRETIKAHGGGRLRRVRLAVGELSAVEPELLKYAWEAVVADGPDQGVELTIEWRPATYGVRLVTRPNTARRGAGCGSARTAVHRLR